MRQVLTYPPPPIIFNNTIYVFCEKLRHLETKYLLKTTPLSFMMIGYLKEAN
jgi:hypothetical protein